MTTSSANATINCESLEGPAVVRTFKTKSYTMTLNANNSEVTLTPNEGLGKKIEIANTVDSNVRNSGTSSNTFAPKSMDEYNAAKLVHDHDKVNSDKFFGDINNWDLSLLRDKNFKIDLGNFGVLTGDFNWDSTRQIPAHNWVDPDTNIDKALSFYPGAWVSATDSNTWIALTNSKGDFDSCIWIAGVTETNTKHKFLLGRGPSGNMGRPPTPTDSTFRADALVSHKGQGLPTHLNFTITQTKTRNYTFYDRFGLDIAVNAWTSNATNVNDIYGDINNWDVRYITDMSSLFLNKSSFNSDISNWDTSNVTNMSSMFEGAEEFDQDISNWDVKNVTNMSAIFKDTKKFNKPLTNWQTSELVNASSMFEGAEIYNQNISNLNLSKVTNMNNFLKNASNFVQDISSLDLNITDDIRTNIARTDMFTGSGIANDTDKQAIYIQGPHKPTVSFPPTGNDSSFGIQTKVGSATYAFRIKDSNGIFGEWQEDNVNGAQDIDSNIPDGIYEIGDIQVKNSDSDGNASEIVSNLAAFTIDTTPPAAPTVTFPLSGNSKTVNVGVESNATWEYSVDNGINWTAGSGTSFSFDLADNTYSAGHIKVKQTDLYKNISVVTANDDVIIIDTEPPAKPTVTYPGNGKINTVTVTKATGATTWEYSVNNGNTWTAGSGNSFNLTDAIYTAGHIKVRNADSYGNVSEETANDYQTTIDTTPPAAPTVGFPGNGKNPNVSVTLATGAITWEYSVDNGNNWTTGSGTSFTLSDATYSTRHIKVRNADSYGNVSDETENSTVLIINTTPPATPTVSFPDNGTSGSVNVTLANGATTWEYSLDSGNSWTEGSGTSVALSDALYSIDHIHVRNSDQWGNTSAATKNSSQIAIDSAAPEPPTFNSIATTDTNDPEVKVNFATGANVIQWTIARSTGDADSDLLWTTVANNSDTFNLPDSNYTVEQMEEFLEDSAFILPVINTNNSATFAKARENLSMPSTFSDFDNMSDSQLAEAALKIQSKQYQDNLRMWNYAYYRNVIRIRNTDDVGLVSGKLSSSVKHTWTGSQVAFFIDTSVPPDIPTDNITWPTQNENQNKIVIADDSLTYGYQMSTDNGDKWSDIVRRDLFYSPHTSPIYLIEGTYQSGYIQFRNVNSVGTFSANVVSIPYQITYDVTAPNPPVVVFPHLGSAGNNNNVQVTIASDAAKWKYSTDSGANWSADQNSLNFTLPDGTYVKDAIRVKNYDAAGNESSETRNGSQIIIDTTGPGTVTGTSFPGALDRNGLVSFNLPNGVTKWKYTVDGGSNWTDMTSGNTFTLTDGTYSKGAIRIQTFDQYDNASDSVISNTYIITIDTKAPEAPTVTFPVNTSTNNTVSVTKASDAVKWEYSVDSGNSWTEGSGTEFTITRKTTYASGAIKVRNNDAAGNVSSYRTHAGSIFVNDPIAQPTVNWSDDRGTLKKPDGYIQVTLSSGAVGDDRGWEYSVDSGANWTAGSLTDPTFVLYAGPVAAGGVTEYPAGRIQVRNWRVPTDKSDPVLNPPLQIYRQNQNNLLKPGSANITARSYNSTFQSLIKAWVKDKADAREKYGHIANWDVTQFTSFNNLFKYIDNYRDDENLESGSQARYEAAWNDDYIFTENLSNWETSQVTRMDNMCDGSEYRHRDDFYKRPARFNADITGWNVSNVRYMFNTFDSASVFNQNISGWAIDLNREWSAERPNDMGYGGEIFKNASSFNQSLSGWKITNMRRGDGSGIRGDLSSMFEGCTAFNPPNGGLTWDGWSGVNTASSYITNTNSMFKNATSFNSYIGNWNMVNVTDMGSMFEGATSFNSQVYQWNVSNVTNMSSMFKNATSFDPPPHNPLGHVPDQLLYGSGWNVSNVINMNYMFEGAISFARQNISGWDLSSLPATVEIDNPAYYEGSGLPETISEDRNPPINFDANTSSDWTDNEKPNFLN